MNKKFTKLIAALVLLVFMMPSMVGWGQTTYSLTPNNEQTGLSNTTYITTLTEFTYNNVSWKMNQWNPSTLQIKTNQSSAASEFRFYNTSAIPGRITQVVMTFSALTVIDASKLMFLGGTSEVSATTEGTAGTWNATDKTLTWTPGASDNFTYFAFYQNGKAASGTNYLASSDAIVVTYETGGSSYPVTTINIDASNLTNNDVYVSTDAGYLTASVQIDGEPLADAPIIWSSSDENVATVQNVEGTGAITLVAAGTTTIMAFYEGMVDLYLPAQATYELNVINTNPNLPGTENNPYTVAQARAAIDAGTGTQGVYATGIVSEIVTAYNSQFGNISYNISTDGTTTADQLQAYRGKSYNGENFTSADDIQVGDEVVVYGDLTKYGSTYEFAANNQLVSLVRPVLPTITVTPLTLDVPASGANGTMTVTYQDFTEIVASVYFCDASGAEATYNWITASINSSSHYVEYNVEPNEGVARTAYFKVHALDNLNHIYSDLVTINQAAAPQPTVTVTPATINAPFAGAEGTLALTYENIEEFISFDYYFCDAEGEELQEDPDWIEAEIQNENDEYSLYYLIDANNGAARTAYIKVYTFDDNLEEVYAIVTVNQAAYEAPHFTWDLSTNSYQSASTTQVTWTCDYANMVIDKASASTNANNYLGGSGSYTSTRFYKNSQLTLSPASDYVIISVVFEATTESYATALANSTWTNATAVANATTVTVTPIDGNVAMVATIGATCGFTAVTVYYTESTVVYYDIELLDVQNGSIAANANRAQAGVVITLTATPNENFYVDDWTILDGDANTINWTDLGTDKTQVTFTMPASDVMVEATFATDLTVTTYTLANTIESGKHYIITNGTDKAMGTQNNNNRAAANVSINNGIASVVGDEVFEFIINGPDANNNYIIYDANEESTGYLYAIANNNYLRTQEFNDADGEWKISFDGNKANIQVTIGETTRIMRFNSSNSVFSCYTSGQQDIYLYVKDNETNYTYVKDIAGYGSASSSTNWYLISSPAQSVLPREVTNLIEPNNHYDLYRFNQSAASEWENYKNEDHADDFDLSMGVGYLYANANNVTLIFTGERYQNAVYYAPLEYDADANLPGMTLVGNPYGHAANVDRTEFYVMNEEGSEIIAGTSNVVEAMQGIFVEAADATDQYVTFTPANGVIYPEGDDKFVLNLTQNRGNVIDRAIVRFGEGRQLPKFQINKNNTKLYIPQDNQDYAVVRSEGQGELPVNFRAAKNGTYTLSIDTESMDVNYLHLIDNMTGMDINLLQTPSYTFEATTRDYESRFKLVFAGASTGAAADETFAFFSNGSLIVSNEGEATLQVVDLTGRILSSESISGSCSTRINATAGVYMLRLINGDNVKVQKIVVR